MSCLTLGEYPDPPCRGVYDLDEDDEVTDKQPPPFPELEWRFGDDEEQLGAPVNLLFVSCTKLASAFLDVYLEPEEPRGGDRFISCSVSVANEAKPAPDSAGAAAVTVVASKELATVQIFARTALCRVEELCDHDDMRGPACHEFSKQVARRGAVRTPRDRPLNLPPRRIPVPDIREAEPEQGGCGRRPDLPPQSRAQRRRLRGRRRRFGFVEADPEVPEVVVMGRAAARIEPSSAEGTRTAQPHRGSRSCRSGNGPSRFP